MIPSSGLISSGAVRAILGRRERTPAHLRELGDAVDLVVVPSTREGWTHPGKVEAPYTVCIASASNLTGLVKSSVECRRTGL